MIKVTFFNTIDVEPESERFFNCLPSIEIGAGYVNIAFLCWMISITYEQD